MNEPAVRATAVDVRPRVIEGTWWETKRRKVTVTVLVVTGSVAVGVPAGVAGFQGWGLS